MRKKLFILFTTLLCSVTAWADDTYYLQSTTEAGTLDTKNFYTTAPCTQTVSVSYDAVNYTKAVKFGGNITAVTSNNYPDRMIRYDCKTTRTDFIIVAYANSSGKTMYVGDVKENATLGSANTVSSTTSVSLNNGSITTKEYSITSTTRASLYVSVGANSNAFVVQIIAIEKGTRHPKPGEIGYQANFNKARLVARSGGTTWLDTTTFTFIPNQNQTAGSTTYYKGQTKGTHYIKFHTGDYPTKTTVNVSSSSTYYIGTSSSATTNSKTTSQSVILNANTDYYINPNGSNIQVTGIKFEAAPYSVTHTLTNITKTSGSTGAGAALSGSDYSAVFAADDGYSLPASITVTIGGNAATAGTDYTWNSSTGAFTVPAAKVTGDIVVTIVGESGGGGCTATANAGADKNTTVNTGVALAATAAGSGKTGTWSITSKPDGSSASTSSFSDVNSATATFTPDKVGNYTLTWTVSCDEGDSEASDNMTVTAACISHSVTAATSTGTNTYGTVSAASATVCEGSTTTVTATPASGYQVTNWAVTGTGATISPSGASSSTSTTLTMGTANVTVTATFGCATPSAPSALVASSTTSSGTTLTITDAANTNNYEIYYSTSSTAPVAGTSATATSTNKTKALTGLTASTTYYVWVRSVCDSTHKSSWTALTGSTFTTGAACTDSELSVSMD